MTVIMKEVKKVIEKEKQTRRREKYDKSLKKPKEINFYIKNFQLSYKRVLENLEQDRAC